MVRKVIMFSLCVVLLLGVSQSAHASDYTPYDGNMSSTYVNYFRDIVTNIGFNDHYVAFRSGQYEYMLVVGDITYNDNQFDLVESGTCYTISVSDGYSSDLSYNVSSLSDFTLNPVDKLIYTDLGDYPDLIDRGAKYEILNTLLLVILLLCFVVFRFFSKR